MDFKWFAGGAVSLIVGGIGVWMKVADGSLRDERWWGTIGTLLIVIGFVSLMVIILGALGMRLRSPIFFGDAQVTDTGKEVRTMSPSRSVMASHSTGGDLPVSFGAPVQRAKEDQENESFWHIPVTLHSDPENKGRDILPGCEFYLNEYNPQGTITNQIPLMIGDAAFDNEFVKQKDLVRGKTYLVPVAWRFEQEKTKQGYITDTRFFRKARELRYPLEPDRRKHRYRLSVMSGEIEHFSPHFYLLRVPKSYTNGQFVLEIEYEGKGSR